MTAPLVLPGLVRAQQAAGVALVIGNSKYKWEASLPNVKRDVTDIAKRFEQLGLRTELVQDTSHEAMKQAIDRFLAASRGARLAVFYYAGHGAYWEQSTYLIPTDVDLGTPEVVKNLPSVRAIREGTRQASARLLIFDSCRNNPADGWRQQWATDLAWVDRRWEAADPDVVQIWSAPPGRIALDGPAGQNSAFAAALLHNLAGTSVDLQALPGKVRRELLVATEGRLLVWDASSLRKPVLLSGPAAPAAGLPMADAARIVELPNAYALAQQRDLLMPQGLLACRPRTPSSESRMVGAFQRTLGSDVSIVVVLAVDDPSAVDVVLMTRYFGAHVLWRIARGTIVGDTLDFRGGAWGSHFTFKWKDANSGSTSEKVINQNAQNNGRIFTGTFTRLDG